MEVPDLQKNHFQKPGKWPQALKRVQGQHPDPQKWPYMENFSYKKILDTIKEVFSVNLSQIPTDIWLEL